MYKSNKKIKVITLMALIFLLGLHITFTICGSLSIVGVKKSDEKIKN